MTDAAAIEECSEHVGLRPERNALLLRHFAEAQPHEIRRHTPPLRAQPRNDPTPLKRIEREPMQEEHCRTLPALDVGNAAVTGVRIFALPLVALRFPRVTCRNRPRAPPQCCCARGCCQQGGARCGGKLPPPHRDLSSSVLMIASAAHSTPAAIQ